MNVTAQHVPTLSSQANDLYWDFSGKAKLVWSLQLRCNIAFTNSWTRVRFRLRPKFLRAKTSSQSAEHITATYAFLIHAKVWGLPRLRVAAEVQKRRGSTIMVVIIGAATNWVRVILKLSLQATKFRMIDLSAIDKVEDRPAGGNRKATRFAPRARTRAPPVSPCYLVCPQGWFYFSHVLSYSVRASVIVPHVMAVINSIPVQRTLCSFLWLRSCFKCTQCVMFLCHVSVHLCGLIQLILSAMTVNLSLPIARTFMTWLHSSCVSVCFQSVDLIWWT